MGDAIWPPHIRMTFGGTLGVPGVEQWSNTLRFHFGGVWAGVPIIGADPHEPDRDELQAACDLLGGAITDWMVNDSAYINNAAIARWVKLNWVQADGTQRDTNTVVTDFTPVGGKKMTAPPPWYTTQVITLRTAVTRGRAHSGRIYPPLVWPGLESAYSPYISAGVSGEIAQAAAAFISSCVDRIDSVTPPTFVDKPHAVVISPGSHLKGTQPLAYDITGCVVDRVPDVMHSRTRSIQRLEGATAEVPAV